MAISVLMAGCPVTPDPNTNDGNDSNEPNVVKGDSGLTGKFVGSERCSACHANQHSNWFATLHAGALETLESIGQENNSVCLPCHTVGFGEAGGFVDRSTTNALAGVGCESCHGPGRDHVENVNDASLRPIIGIESDTCAQCHTGEHHPNFEDWEMSAHAEVNAEVAPRLAAGTSAASCGVCHSGDVFFAKLSGETITDNFLAGRSVESLNGITCVVCHDPHMRTGNAAEPEDGRDYQLRFPQVKFAAPTSLVADVTNPDRFNLCGQCHHARDRVWTDGSREPHPSDQVNVFFGELPLPASNPDPIVPVRASVHLNAPEQCSTCHVFRSPLVEGLAPAVSGHTFEVNFGGCVDCHGTEEIAEAKLSALESELAIRSARVKSALETWASLNNVDNKGLLSWEYTSEGGPNNAGQAKIPDAIKKARYLYYYVIQGGGSGVHNPDFVRESLVAAEDYALSAPPALP